MMASNQSFASPTESEFSDVEGPESAKHWDENRVCDWLRSVNCEGYEKLFRKNNINGENLLEMDKAVLQEMGIDKIGDRVRLFLGIKKLRTKAYANAKKRNRVSACSGSIVAMTDHSRTPLLLWTITSSTHLRLPALHDHHIPAVEDFPLLHPARDIRDSTKISTLPPFQKMSANLHPDLTHLSLLRNCEL